jgi:hypothetical protein
MSSQFDESDFIDRDYESSQSSYPAMPGVLKRPPTREELDARVAQAQQKLSELRQAQEKLERERTALEEARRRRVEFQTGREEMQKHLAHGIGLLEQAEFAARRDSEQMTKTLTDLREHLTHIQLINEEHWSQENWNVELSKAMAIVENARMEWNGARLKWTLLDGQPPAATKPGSSWNVPALLDGQSFWQLCRVGLALTWPVAVIGLIALLLILIFRLT